MFIRHTGVMSKDFDRKIEVMSENFQRRIEHQMGIMSEDFQHKLDLVVEGQQMLAEKIDRMDGRLSGVEGRLDRVEIKVDALSADLAAHRADTEAVKQEGQVDYILHEKCKCQYLFAPLAQLSTSTSTYPLQLHFPATSPPSETFST
jgi:hypothetical protein